MAALPKCMPHFHLPLQAGSDDVLRQMRRRYTTAEFAHLVENLRRVFGDDVGITTDIMVGFPGETDAHFEAVMSIRQGHRIQPTACVPLLPSKRHTCGDLPGSGVSTRLCSTQPSDDCSWRTPEHSVSTTDAWEAEKRCSSKRAEKGQTTTSQALLTTISVSLWMPQRAQSIRSRALLSVR